MSQLKPPKTMTMLEIKAQVSEVAELTLGYKTKRLGVTKISRSDQSALIFREKFDSSTIELRESFYAMYMNRANNVIGVIKISEGGTSGTVVDAKFIIAGAALSNASAVILCHNHPSGNLRPSDEDIKITKTVKELLKTMGVTLFDHVILVPDTAEKVNSYYSFADEGMM